MTGVLAHQGGWDEILLVLLPIAIFAGLLAVANRRANRMVGSPRPDGAQDDDDAARPGGPPDAPPPAP